MEEYTTTNGIWNGWYWRFVGLVVLALSALELVAKFAIRYPIYESLTLGVLVVSYIVVPRVKERRLANALVAVLLTFVIGFVLQLFLDSAALSKPILMSNGLALLLGLVMAYFYLKLTEWSERKRVQMEAKRRDKNTDSKTTPPVRRHHSTKRGKKKGKKR